jgi:hypothetical protein
VDEDELGRGAELKGLEEGGRQVYATILSLLSFSMNLSFRGARVGI